MTETRWLTDDEQRMWRRYRNLHQLLDLAIERQLQRDARLSTPDYAVLVCLSESGSEGLRARELGGALGWDRSRVSHQVRRMEARGLVSKRECADDGRGTLVVLTEQGSEAIRECAPKHVEKVRELFIDHVSKDELRMLTEVFDRIIDRIEEVDGIHLPI